MTKYLSILFSLVEGPPLAAQQTTTGGKLQSLKSVGGLALNLLSQDLVRA